MTVRVSVTLEMRVEREMFPTFPDAMELVKECRAHGEQVDFDLTPIEAGCENVGNMIEGDDDGRTT